MRASSFFLPLLALASLISAAKIDLQLSGAKSLNIPPSYIVELESAGAD